MMMSLVREVGHLRQEPTKTASETGTSGHLRVRSSRPGPRKPRTSRRSFEAVTGRTPERHEARMVVSGGTEHAFNSTPDEPVRRRWFAGSSDPFSPGGRAADPGWTSGERNPSRAPT
ncbi:unnamed protein product [Lasius platythorax]|uniref:Uncharacterized protein n=1 Tax=Lasius platythorax TaxID=488582 RepID=A0AAV2NRV8_9HYME